MIRLMNQEDIENIMDIWITATVSSHRFINQSFWLKQYRKVKQELNNTNTYVICEQDRIVGFASIKDHKLLCLLVISGMQNKGLGSLLIKHLKTQYDDLHAEIYVKNDKALRFFKKHGFEIASQHKNPDSHQIQNLIQWQVK